MRRRALLSAGLAAGSAALAGCPSVLFGDWETRSDERTFEVTDGTPVRVRTRNGDVALESHDGTAVEVDVTFRARSEDALDRLDLVGEERSGEFVVEPTDVDSDRATGAELSVRLPASLPVAGARTTNGDVTAIDVAGGGRFETRNGDVEVRGLARAAVRSTNGDVTVRDVEEFRGAVTTNGDAAADVPAPLPGDASVRSTNGSVDAAVSPDVDARLLARTTNGDVSVDGLDLADASVGDDRVTGRLGDGTHELELVTTNGDVDVRVLE